MKRELLIFGAFGALGKGASEYLINKDYDHIYLLDYETPDDYKASGKVSCISTGDLTDEDNIEKSFKNISPSKEKYFYLFSTIGGFTGGKKVSETDFSEWQKMLNMNLNINFLLAKHFSLLVEKSSGGSICFTSARTSLFPEEKKASYGTSKAALNHLVESLSIEGEKINMSVNAIAPFIIDTPANREWMPDADHTQWAKPKEIGKFIYNLFDNFHYISGNVILLSKRFQINQ